MKSRINTNYQPIALIIVLSMVFLCVFLHVDAMSSVTLYLDHAQSCRESIILPGHSLSNELDIPRSSVRSSIGALDEPREFLVCRTGTGSRHSFFIPVFCIPSIWLRLIRAYLPRLFSRNIPSLECSIITYLHRSDGMKPLPIM